jgi:hypothetical protein
MDAAWSAQAIVTIPCTTVEERRLSAASSARSSAPPQTRAAPWKSGASAPRQALLEKLGFSP